MKSKKGIIILSTVVIACAVGFIVSPLVNWSVDESNASGDIAKSSRFSRKTAAESLTNMEELLVNDEEYKNRTVVAHVVMQTRARQFGNLVNLSNEVAGDIPEFASVLKDMNEARVMADNTCLALLRATNDISSTLNGEACPDLAQNTINASLAYTTLQKQNKLADRFIATTDSYLKKSEGDDLLKFIRDQWVEYQLLTATLNGDEKSAQALKDKGYLLNPAQSVATLNCLAGYPVICILAEDMVTVSLQPEAGAFGEQFADVAFDGLLNAQDLVIMSAIQEGTELGIGADSEEVFHQVMDQVFSDQYEGSLHQLTGEMVNQLTGEMVNQLTGEMVNQLTGEMVNQLTGEMVNQLTGEMVNQLTGEMVNQLTGEMVNQLVGEMVNADSKTIFGAFADDPVTLGHVMDDPSMAMHLDLNNN